MLSIAKLRVGQEAYQLSGVAQSLYDYYTGVGEASGQWAGVGATRLGLNGDVVADDLRAVLAGIAPGTAGLSPNGETINPHAKRVPGFDLTFKAPKSVSVLYAVSDDPRVQAAIVEAGEHAVRHTLGWLEREALHVRRGTGNEKFLNDLAARDPEAAAAARIRSHPASGAVAAVFRHRTSRAGDPLLHWHTLVANLAEGPDGRWTAIVHPDLYRAQRAAGEVFQTVLRDELTDRLGITWRPGRHVPEIASVPQTLLDQFSKRSQEIDQWLAATGTPGDQAGRQAAVLATRRAKPEVEHERFDTAWKAEATLHGWGPEQAENLLRSLGDAHRVDVDLDDRWVADIARHLTEHDSTFGRNDLVQAVATRLHAGASMRQIERTVAAVLASPHIIPVGDNGDRWTSDELLTVERRFLTTAATSADARSSLPSDMVNAVLAEFATIGDDQRAAVTALSASTDAMTVLVGPAGTGKTFTLNAVRAAYTAGGYSVIGAAPSARAAHELEQGAHIQSATIHRLLGAWERGYELPGPETVLVLDEAAMAGTRELEALTRTVIAAGGRTILVGDHHQLPEVTAGGAFAALATRSTVTVAELTVNRRQTHDWERAALEQLRHGYVPEAVNAYHEHGRVHIATDRVTMIDDAIRHWSDARDAGHATVLIAGTNSTVNALNHAARTHLLEARELGEHLGTWGGRDLAIGERIVLRANDYSTVDTAGRSTPLLNGHTATVIGASGDGLLARLDHTDTTVRLDRFYAEHSVDYAYALTSHRAQGGTWDLAIAVGADGLYREAGYLVLSRGRYENLLILTATEADAIDRDLARHDSPLVLPDEHDDTDAELLRRLTTRRAKTLALTNDPHADLINNLAERLPLATLEALAANASDAESRAVAVVGARPEKLQELIDRATSTVTHVAVGQTVKPTDRNNLGVVMNLDDPNGQVVVEFTSTDGRTAERTFRWDEISILEPRHPDERIPSPVAEAALAAIVDEHRGGIDRWAAILAEVNVAVDDPRIYRQAAMLHIDRAAARLAADQPKWLIAALGNRPYEPASSQLWDDAVRDIAAFRARHQVSDPLSPLGPEPADGSAFAEWRSAGNRLETAADWLDTYAPQPIGNLRVRSLTEIVERRAQLDAILATAPPDQRQIVAALTSGQLTLTDASELLQTALAGQSARQNWIVEHWPHIVELAQLELRSTPRIGPPVPEILEVDLL